MGIRSDPLEPLLTSLNAVKNAYSSIDVGIRKAVRDLELHRDLTTRNDLQNYVSFKFGCSEKDVLIRGNGGVNDLMVCGNGLMDFGVGKIENRVQLGLMWSSVVNTFGKALPTPAMMGNKMFQIEGDAGGVSVACLKLDLGAIAVSLASKDYQKKDSSCEFVEEKGNRHTFLDLSVGVLFDHVCQSLQQVHHNMIVNNNNVLTGYSSFISKTSLAANENRLIQNLHFAKISVPSAPRVMEVISTLDEKSDNKIIKSAENIVPSSSRNQPTGSLSGLKLQLEHPLQDDPEQKELLPEHNSFMYKKSEVANRIIGSESESSDVQVAAPANEHIENVLKSALAGGFSCALSAFIMHPVDTVKTQVQASTLSLPEIISKLPQIGTQGLYRGIVPAVVGQFSSHGLRTGICEIIKFILVNVAPTMPDLQVESVSSFCGTMLGTTSRIPSEVLKQRLQAGLYKNLGEAIIGTWKQDGLKAFFRGTGATLCREIPFYVAGMGLYTESKKVVQRLIGRQLEPWEIVVVGAVAGGLAAVTTTPFDVIKTRMMIATGRSPESMSAIALSILQQEGPLGLFKGAVPRFFWVAPLGAMNFAGYELARKALG